MCKVRDKTIRRHAKAERKEHKLAEKMNRVALKHDTTLSREKKLAQVSDIVMVGLVSRLTSLGGVTGHSST